MDESRLLHLNAARARHGAATARDEWTSVQLTQLADQYEREARRLNLAEFSLPLRARMR